MPVTVLRVDNCQVVAQRTAEKDGYTAVQLGAGTRKAKNITKALRGHFAAPRSSRSARSPSSASSPENLIDVGAEITADHFVPGQFVDVTGTSIGKGFAGRHEAPQLRRPSRHARRLGLAPLARLDRPAPGSRQGVQGQEDGRPYGQRARDHAEPAGRPHRCRPRPDHGRAARCRAPRAAGCLVRDAVKRTLPKARRCRRVRAAAKAERRPRAEAGGEA